MQHHDSDSRPFGGNRPAHGARIVDTSKFPGTHQSKDEAVDFLGLGDFAPANADEATQVQAAAVAATTAAAAQPALDGSWLLDAPEAARPEAEPSALARLLADPANEEPAAPAVEARPAVYAAAPSAPAARRSWPLAAVVVACLAGGGIAWWRHAAPAAPAAPGARSAQLPQTSPSSKPDTLPVSRKPAAERPASAPASPVAVAPVPAKSAPATAVPAATRPAPADLPAPVAPVAKAAPATTPPAAAPVPPAAIVAAPQPSAAALPVPQQPAPVMRSPAAPPVAKAAPPATTPSRALASDAYQSQPTHAAVQARLAPVQRAARRYGWSLLGLHGSSPAQRHPAGEGLAPGSIEPAVAAVLPALPLDSALAADVPRVVRDLQQEQPERSSGPRRLRPEDQPYTHQGADVPMQRIQEVRRILTPKVGRVRVTVNSGEVFEGVLYAVGEGSVWLDTDLGRMALPSEGVRDVETLTTTSAAPALGEPGSQNLAGLRRVRVTCPGGVFTGALLSQQGDEVVLVTDEGSRIRLRAQKIESVSREGTQIRGRVAEPAKKKP